ncbi:hypothetical protein BDV24DRAFT_170108 [Aspergillus arachidicola]|uniref:C6 transcription factor n=1 Tax=Aspergillus arachidicola TaxID=656916 RepID=A0A5N6XMQ6_9EURO|nr:hypothetical protein BDV24DRAFT_170108 [Aspergillus arachidicola]
MLEQYQVLLIDGIKELYKRSFLGNGWPDKPVERNAAGDPLIHDILSRLRILDRVVLKDTVQTDQNTDHERRPENTEQAVSQIVSGGGMEEDLLLPSLSFGFSAPRHLSQAENVSSSGGTLSAVMPMQGYLHRSPLPYMQPWSVNDSFHMYPRDTAWPCVTFGNPYLPSYLLSDTPSAADIMYNS